MKYIVKDENGETMRIVGRQEKARQLVTARAGWSFTGVRSPKVKLDLSQFKDALF
jgi:hypothetical protein